MYLTCAAAAVVLLYNIGSEEALVLLNISDYSKIIVKVSHI